MSGLSPDELSGTAGKTRVRVEIFVDASNFHPAIEESGVAHPVAFGRLATELTRGVGGTNFVALHNVAGAYPAPRDTTTTRT
jgi:hypothetical protein